MPDKTPDSRGEDEAVARQLSKSLGVDLDEVLAVIREKGPWPPGATITGEGSLTVGTPRVFAYAEVASATGTALGATVIALPGEVATTQDEVAEVADAMSSGRGIPALTARQAEVLAALIAALIIMKLPAAERQGVMENMGVFAMVYAVITILRGMSGR